MAAFVANTNVLDLTGLRNEITDAYINDATVTVTVKDSDGAEVAGQVWPLTMSYVAASDGNYRAFLSAQLPFVAKAKYTAFIEANGGANLVGHWEFHFKPTARSSNDS
jgi:hypothetical protein